MTSEKILEAAQACKRILVSEGVPIARFSTSEFPQWQAERLAHAHYCVDQIINVFVPAGRQEKAFRWLGFVQGVLWAEKIVVLDDLKNQNRPDETK